MTDYHLAPNALRAYAPPDQEEGRDPEPDLKPRGTEVAPTGQASASRERRGAAARVLAREHDFLVETPDRMLADELVLPGVAPVG